ncbi:MAG: isoprenylcysteine carboxylmethyltransferase family protein [Patescibacteria group bacterium]
MSKRFREAARNYASTMAFLFLTYGFYWGSGRFAHLFTGKHVFPAFDMALTTDAAFVAIIWTYAAVLPLYYAFERGESSAYRFFKGFLKRDFGEEWKKAGRSLALKAFFAPLMIGWTLSHASQSVIGIERYFFSGNLDWNALTTVPFFAFAFQAVLFADVFFFTAGYLLEAGILKNRIVSVDPTVSGWVVCLLCYPPFNGATNTVLGWYSSDTPVLADSPSVTLVLNALVVSLMAFYAYASVALGWKASNLTNRGIVAKGPYRWMRHPAYAAKNLAWWVGAVPALATAWGTSNFVFALASLSAWTFLYYLRAATEERHLLMADNGYAEYAKAVPYRFVPGVW